MDIQSMIIDLSSLHAYVHSTISTIEYIHFIFLLCCIYFLYYVTHIVHKPVLHCSDKQGFEGKLKEYITELNVDQWPIVWCYRALPQTILHSVFGHTYNLKFEREIIPTKDGGNFTLDWYGFEDNNNFNETPIIVVMPGATGHSQKNYVQQCIMQHRDLSYRTVVFNNRGLGNGVKLASPLFSCVTRGDDTEQTLKTVTERYPSAPVMVVAFSIGACIFTNYLARRGKDIPDNLLAAYIISVPWNSFESKRNLSEFWNKLIINKHMTGELIGLVKRNYEVFTEKEHELPINLESILLCDTIWDFDDRYTCPMFGYKDHVVFYEDASLDNQPLEDICIPILNLNADDDPLCRRRAVPFQKIQENSFMAVITTKYGGHMSWLEGFYLSPRRLHHRIFQQYADMIFSDQDKWKQVRHGQKKVL